MTSFYTDRIAYFRPVSLNLLSSVISLLTAEQTSEVGATQPLGKVDSPTLCVKGSVNFCYGFFEQKRYLKIEAAKCIETFMLIYKTARHQIPEDP
jgi:hypothetical protein